MATLERALQEFGRDVGVESLQTGAAGSVQLRFESGGSLGFSRQGEDVLLHWAEPAPYDAPELLLRAFKHAASPQPGELALQVGLHSEDGLEHLVLATRVRESDCSGRELHRLVGQMKGYVERLRT